jgi:hypothetical protein
MSTAMALAHACALDMLGCPLLSICSAPLEAGPMQWRALTSGGLVWWTRSSNALRITSPSKSTVTDSFILHIACDPIDRNLAIAGDGMFGFDLPEGITAERAAEIARFMSEHLICMSYTFF